MVDNQKKINFTKMHGCKNDYLYIDCTKNVLENPAEVSIKLSDRHTGIGSDGIILIRYDRDFARGENWSSHIYSCSDNLTLFYL